MKAPVMASVKRRGAVAAVQSPSPHHADDDEEEEGGDGDGDVDGDRDAAAADDFGHDDDLTPNREPSAWKHVWD